MVTSGRDGDRGGGAGGWLTGVRRRGCETVEVRVPVRAESGPGAAA